MAPYRPTPNNKIYGLHVPYDQGYDARSHRNAPTAEQHDSSGYLRRPDGAQIDMWIEEISADFSLSGTSGQSRMKRDFYPHSFNDVKLMVKGRVASTQEYNRLALFVREHHWRALDSINGGGTADQTLQFVLHNTYGNGHTWRKPRSQDSELGHALTNTKGPHRPWSVNGFVESINAGATRFEVAPQFEFAFVVTRSEFNASTGIWEEHQELTGSYLSTILQLANKANNAPTDGFIKDPLATEAAIQATTGKAVSDIANWTTQAAKNILGSIL